MDEELLEPLPAEAQLALAHSPPATREPLRIYLELDRRLARIVSVTTEPMLGQMRLAWWRDMLAKDRDARPRGDAVLDRVGEHWRGEERALIELVDGWEEMLSETFERIQAEGFVAGRAAPFAVLARMADVGADADACLMAGRQWALADAASHIGEGAERDVLLDLARSEPATTGLPRSMRGLAVLEALARRSIARGGPPLMEGRGASLVAARAAIIGR